MFQGQLVRIFVTQRKGDDLQGLARVEAVKERGLVGDRYFLQVLQGGMLEVGADIRPAQ